MWVILKENYCGPAGLFVKGHKMDLTKEQVAKIRKEIGDKNIIETCAPWDEKIDKKAVERNALYTKANAAIKKAELIISEIEKLSGQIKAGQQQLAKLQKEQNNAVNAAKTLARKAGIQWRSKKDAAGPENAGQSQ